MKSGIVYNTKTFKRELLQEPNIEEIILNGILSHAKNNIVNLLISVKKDRLTTVLDAKQSICLHSKKREVTNVL